MADSIQCPLCKKKFVDLPKHLRFYHEIDSMEKYDQEKNKLERIRSKKIEFAKYVEDLQAKQRNGDISIEEYRELITKWYKENKH